MSPADERFLSTTRGKIVLMLRRGALTVEEIARAVDLTRNMVRNHLVSLESDQLVRLAGHRRGSGGRPARLYELTPQAEQQLSQAYAPVFRQLLNVLREQMTAEALRKLLDEVAQRVAEDDGLIPTRGEPRERLIRAAALLEQLGGPGLIDDARVPAPSPALPSER
jgi:DeoR family transcriptional regulator, suf operon transcriptional repressor